LHAAIALEAVEGHAVDLEGGVAAVGTANREVAVLHARGAAHVRQRQPGASHQRAQGGQAAAHGHGVEHRTAQHDLLHGALHVDRRCAAGDRDAVLECTASSRRRRAGRTGCTWSPAAQLDLRDTERAQQVVTVSETLARRADAGQPVANATVRAMSAGEGFRSFGDCVETTTDDDGRFAFALGGQQACRIASRMDLGSVEVDTVATADLHLPLVLRR